jgi:hypothetical protein
MSKSNGFRSGKRGLTVFIYSQEIKTINELKVNICNYVLWFRFLNWKSNGR